MEGYWRASRAKDTSSRRDEDCHAICPLAGHPGRMTYTPRSPLWQPLVLQERIECLVDGGVRLHAPILAPRPYDLSPSPEDGTPWLAQTML